MTSWAHSTSYVVNTMNFKNHNTIFESLDLLTTRNYVNKYLNDKGASLCSVLAIILNQD